MVAGSRVGIVGGSVAGCAMAVAAANLDCEVVVFEASSGLLEDRGARASRFVASGPMTAG
jgi:pyruvate/2-oxoglutarate dehydrogenase complex dihydrolipoamide dehydrogenase (E3) component